MEFKLTSKLMSIILSTCLIFTLIPQNGEKVDANNSFKGTVQAYILNVREQPSINSKIVGKLQNNETIVVEKINKDWGRITLNSQSVFININYIKEVEQLKPIEVWVTPTVSVLNVRESASTHSKIIGKLIKGESVQVTSKENNWVVFIKDDKKNYVYLPYLTEATNKVETIDNVPTKVEKGKISVSSLNIRKEPTVTSKIIGTYAQNETVAFTKENEKWFKVAHKNQTGYIYSMYVDAPNNEKVDTTTEKLKMSPTTDRLNIRKEATVQSNIMGTLAKNDVIDVIKKIGEWVQFTRDGDTVYAHAGFLEQVKVETSPPPKVELPVQPVETTNVGTVTVNSLNVREESNTYSNVLGVLQLGDTITINAETGDWLAFTYQGKSAFVHKNFVSLNKREISQPVTQEPIVEKPVEPIYGYITVSALNARQQPTTDSQIVDVLSKNKKVEVVSVENNWGKIKLENSYAYVSMSYISYEIPKIEEVLPEKWSYVVDTSALNVRSSSSINGVVIGKVHQGEKLNVVGVEGDWLNITYGEKNAFVSAKYVKKTSSTSTLLPMTSLVGRKIVVDAGHGGKDVGAVGNGLTEKDITLDVVLKLKTKLEDAGATVVLSRNDNTYYALSERTRVSNNSGADLFVSIHGNSSEHKSASGTETFYYRGGDERAAKSYKLAQSIHTEMINRTGFGNRGIKTDHFQVIKYNQLPSVLVELGFISNPYESSQLAKNEIRQKFADSILIGINNYFK